MLNKIFIFEFLWNFFYFILNEKTPLQIAIEKGNAEIIKLLLKCQNIDVNLKSILIFYFILFQIQLF